MRTLHRTLQTFVLLTLTFSQELRADRTLVLEDLLTDRGQVKVDLALSYSKEENRGVSAADPVTIQTGPTSFVTVPSAIEERSNASEAIVVSMGLRYGHSENTEFYARTNWLYGRQRNQDIVGYEQTNTKQFVDAWAGISHRFKDDTETPAVIGFAELAMWERNLYTASTLKSALLGLTVYKALDPVVLTLTGAYRINQSRTDGGHYYKPGNLFLLSPSIGFAANDQITLLTGLQWTTQQSDIRKGFPRGRSQNQLELVLGMGYGLTNNTIFNVTLRDNISGRSSAALRINLLHTL